MKLILPILIISAFSFGQVPNYVPTNSLSAWYSFSGNTNDNSTNALNLTNNGAVLTNDRMSNTNSAYSFNGTINQYLSIPNPANELLDMGTADFTISVWFKTASDTVLSMVYKRRIPQIQGQNYEGYSFFLNKGYVRFGLEDINTSTTQVYDSSYQYNDNLWHQAVIVRNTNEDSLYLYVDGVKKNSALDNSISTTSANEPLYIGRWFNYDNYSFDGNLDDIGFWKRALSPCEIQDLYNAQLNSTDFTVTQVDVTLTANQSNAVYQWLDCDANNMEIIQATDQSFSAGITGNYSVEVDMNGCIDTSACYFVDYTSLDELQINHKEVVKVVDLLGRETTPEPNKTLIYIYSDGTSEKVFKVE